ncbi:MAG: hypothetical protein JNN27_23145 [Planctomycetes bacterium]|nr:hypothetical protein [Planctomycetota bacterium]
MSAAVLAAALATALSAGVLALDLTTLSSAALVGAVWVALAPLTAALAERPSRCALALLAVSVPQLALAVAADRSAGVSLERLLPLALAALVWTAALGASATASVLAGRGERWLGVWSAFAGAGPLVALALRAAGDGGEHWLPEVLTRVSPLATLVGASPLGAHGAVSDDVWSACLLPSAALLVAARIAKVSLRKAASDGVSRGAASGAEASDGS